MHKEELHDLYGSPNIIRVVGLMKMECAGHMALMVKTSTCRDLGRKTERSGSRERGLYGNIILK